MLYLKLSLSNAIATSLYLCQALEYAKSIAKPHPKPRPKKHQDHSGGGLHCDAHLEGLELAQLEALEDMRRRHEEEKRAVAAFQKGRLV